MAKQSDKINEIFPEKENKDNTYYQQIPPINSTQMQSHPCSHEEDWKEFDCIKDRVHDLEKDKEIERKDREKRDEKLKEAFDNNTSELKEIKEIVIKLDKQQVLTDAHNGYQDEKLEGIQEKERKEIQNKAQNKGIIYGAVLTFILILIADYLRATLSFL